MHLIMVFRYPISLILTQGSESQETGSFSHIDPHASTNLMLVSVGGQVISLIVQCEPSLDLVSLPQKIKPISKH